MNAAQRKAMEQALEALEAMKAEFRALDLPYGSKAYTQGNHASHELRAVLAEPPCKTGAQCIGNACVGCEVTEQTPVAADDAGIYEFWARNKEAEQKASKELDPKDIFVELVAKPVSGFAPTRTNGVRLTHRPTGISVEETDERSPHKNKHIAWEKLKQLVAAAEEAEQPALTATYTCGVCGVSMQMEQPAEQSAKHGEPVGEVHWAADVPSTVKEVRWTDYVTPPVGTKLYTAPQPVIPEGCVVVTRAVLNKLGVCDEVIDTIARAATEAPQSTNKTNTPLFVYLIAKHPGLADELRKLFDNDTQ